VSRCVSVCVCVTDADESHNVEYVVVGRETESKCMSAAVIRYDTIRYDTINQFNVRLKATLTLSQINCQA